MNIRFKSKAHMKLIALLLILVMVLSGCDKNKNVEKVDSNATVVFQYGDSIVTLGEVYIYSKTVGERYER